MARRQRIDSNAAAVKIVQALKPSPPSHVVLGDNDRQFWRSVVAEFPNAEWTDHQLEVAAQLAKAMADLEQERNSLRGEGYILADDRGKSYANPRHGVARDLTNSVMSLRRNLSLHARAMGGEARDVGKRRERAKDVEVELGDELIARPSLQ